MAKVRKTNSTGRRPQKLKRSTGARTGKRRVTPLIVGVGASAGGLEAFTQLLQHLPTDTGMAFVLVQHLFDRRAPGGHPVGLITHAPVMPESARQYKSDPVINYDLPPPLTVPRCRPNVAAHLPRPHTGLANRPNPTAAAVKCSRVLGSIVRSP